MRTANLYDRRDFLTYCGRPVRKLSRDRVLLDQILDDVLLAAVYPA
ncbi:hypothetical protein MYX75_12055 [Acidobacteria bacterium AH-259-A15]|nr:hypothetical protein [Acidobacteria bacterium AH-259-A15]